MQELEREENLSIVNAMVAMGRGMKLTVIAEGVETVAQRDRLQQMRCHEMQGYCFSAPLAAHAATALLGRDARDLEQDEQRVAVQPPGFRRRLDRLLRARAASPDRFRGR